MIYLHLSPGVSFSPPHTGKVKHIPHTNAPLTSLCSFMKTLL